MFEQVTRGAESLARVAVLAFGFVYIHPMRDGNGRIHRFLINDILVRDKAIPDGVAQPAAYTASSGKRVDAGDIDLLARIFSMGKLHHAMTGTGAVAIAVAATIPDTVVSRLFEEGARGQVRFGHPSGCLAVGAEAVRRDGEWVVSKAIMSRSARRLMDGMVYAPIVGD